MENGGSGDRVADLAALRVPEFLNYVGVFLTIDCNLGCAYCINDPEQAARRQALFGGERRGLTPDQWIRGLRRIPFREDLPLTLQGGEPTIYAKATGIGRILEGIPHYCDLLTNLVLSPQAFARCIDRRIDAFQRDAPYPSIRVSWHPDEMKRVWGEHACERLVAHCEALADLGFTVSPRKEVSDVGIYMVDVPGHEVSDEMRRSADGRVPFEKKPFLGTHDGQLYGSYRYPYSTDLVASGAHPHPLQADCRTTELLLDPMGFAWSCHFYLYETWKGGGPRKAFEQLTLRDFRFEDVGDELSFGALRPIGHILDPRFEIERVHEFHPCAHYGRCIGCDTKIKNDRFQSLDDANAAHTSVEIENIRFPAALKRRIEREALSPQLASPPTPEVVR